MHNKILIIGYGVVGKNLEKELEKMDPDICDKYQNIHSKQPYHDFGFICVNTPLRNNALDISEVKAAILENECGIYIAKSTCPVGTIDNLKQETGKRIVFSPEYYGETQHCNNYDFNFTILGGAKEDCQEVVQVLQNVYDGRHHFHIVDARTAELAKFMENSWLATKVTFCNAFFRAAEREGVSYEELRELFLLDPRVNPSHTFVYRDHPYFQSKCLDKDVPAAASQLESEFLHKILEINDGYKNDFVR